MWFTILFPLVLRKAIGKARHYLLGHQIVLAFCVNVCIHEEDSPLLFKNSSRSGGLGLSEPKLALGIRHDTKKLIINRYRNIKDEIQLLNMKQLILRKHVKFLIV